jgi:hypothetical protein
LGRLDGVGSRLLCAVGGISCPSGGFRGGLGSRFRLFGSFLRRRCGRSRTNGYRPCCVRCDRIPFCGAPVAEQLRGRGRVVLTLTILVHG